MASSLTEFRRTDMAGLGQILSRTFFWSYERGSWQYDIAVILILVFVLLTPRGWFRDQPQVGLPANTSQVELLSKSGENEVYRVDARVLAPPERTPALHDGRFSIGTIEPQRDEKGNVVAYEVTIRH